MRNKIAIVVPFYNVELFFRRCLQSLVDSHVEGVEFYLIDDQSPDGSRKIADEFAKNYEFIKVFTNAKNIGQGPSRHEWLHAIDSEWIVFLDSDDFVYEDFCSTLVSQVNDEYDVINFDYNVVDEQDKILVYGNKIHDYNGDRIYLAPHYLWQKMFRRSVIENVIQPNKFAEDYYAWFQVLENTKRVNFIQDILIAYRRREGSDSFGGLSEKKVNDFYELTKLILEKNSHEEIIPYIYKNIYFTPLVREMYNSSNWKKIYYQNERLMDDYFGETWKYNELVNELDNWVLKQNITKIALIWNNEQYRLLQNEDKFDNLNTIVLLHENSGVSDSTSISFSEENLIVKIVDNIKNVTSKYVSVVDYNIEKNKNLNFILSTVINTNKDAVIFDNKGVSDKECNFCGNIFRVKTINTLLAGNANSINRCYFSTWEITTSKLNDMDIKLGSDETQSTRPEPKVVIKNFLVSGKHLSFNVDGDFGGQMFINNKKYFISTNAITANINDKVVFIKHSIFIDKNDCSQEPYFKKLNPWTQVAFYEHTIIKENTAMLFMKKVLRKIRRKLKW